MPSPRPSDFALTSAGALRIYSTDELMSMPPVLWQVGGLIPENALAVLYGPSGCGKTFEAMNLSLCVASGLPWHTRPTTKGFVLYVSGEGRAGLGQRVSAWMQNTTLDSRDVDIAWLPEAIDVYAGSEHIDILFNRFEEMEVAPDLVVIDTLARCFMGDENKTEDMGNFIRGCDRIRNSFGCTVLVVHHTNTADARERGNGSLRGGSDVMIRMMPGVLGTKSASPYAREQETRYTLLVDKQKDAPHGPIGIGRLRPVQDTRSCVCEMEWAEPEMD
jgi:RecA-family ATPase